MTVMGILGGVLYYVALPFSMLFWLALRVLNGIITPIIALVRFLISIPLLPLYWLAKFETVFIYLGLAALIGLCTGSILHLSSSVLASILNSNSSLLPKEKCRTAATFRAAREQRALENAWRNSSSKPQNGNQSGSDTLEERYAQWLEKDPNNAKRNIGLFGQTILEEDDSSMDGF